MFNEVKKKHAPEKSSIVRNLTKHLGEMWITDLKNFNMLGSGSTFSSLHIRRSAGNNNTFFVNSNAV